MSDDAIRSMHVAASPARSGLDGPPGPHEEVVAIFDQMRDRLLRYLVSLRLPEQDGEEITQEAFLALFRHLERGRPQHNLRGWIFQVTHNLALKRREQNRRNRESLIELGATRPDASRLRLNPEDQLLDNQRRARLFAAWQALPDPDRHLLALRAEGLTYREIAEVLKISLGSVSASLGRSLARFTRAGQR
jgi:RNA polymerase sigma-70 factor (ECF subfamily)